MILTTFMIHFSTSLSVDHLQKDLLVLLRECGVALLHRRIHPLARSKSTASAYVIALHIQRTSLNSQGTQKLCYSFLLGDLHGRNMRRRSRCPLQGIKCDAQVFTAHWLHPGKSGMQHAVVGCCNSAHLFLFRRHQHSQRHSGPSYVLHRAARAPRVHLVVSAGAG